MKRRWPVPVWLALICACGPESPSGLVGDRGTDDTTDDITDGGTDGGTDDTPCATMSVDLFAAPNGFNGEGHSRYVNTYTADGRILTHDQDVGADGNVDLHEVYTYDEDANLAAIDSYFGWWAGEESSGRERETFTYDEDGNMLTDALDTGANGTVDTQIDYTYDEEGHTLTAKQYNKGELWSVGLSSYDAQGNLIELGLHFESLGGALGQRLSYTYDDDHHRLTYTRDDLTANMGPEQIETYSYDDQGRLVLAAIDDGSPESSADGADGITNWKKQYIYDGLELRMIEDRRVVGTLISRTTFTYDAQGRVLTQEVDQDGDGEVDLTTVYSYTDC